MNIPQCIISKQKFLLQNDVLWDMGQLHCGICEIGLTTVGQHWFRWRFVPNRRTWNIYNLDHWCNSALPKFILLTNRHVNTTEIFSLSLYICVCQVTSLYHSNHQKTPQFWVQNTTSFFNVFDIVMNMIFTMVVKSVSMQQNMQMNKTAIIVIQPCSKPSRIFVWKLTCFFNDGHSIPDTQSSITKYFLGYLMHHECMNAVLLPAVYALVTPLHSLGTHLI